MNPQLILGLALVLSGGLFGCTTVPQPSDKSEQSSTPLYLHSIVPTFPGGTQPGHLVLSTQIYFSKDFFTITTNSIDNIASLKGNVIRSQQKIVAHIEGLRSGTTSIFDGEIVPDKLVGPQITAYSGCVNMTFFVLSTNRNCETFLTAQAFDDMQNEPGSSGKLDEWDRKILKLQIGLESLPKNRTNSIVPP